MKRLAFLASAFVASSLALPVKATENPYAYVLGASAVNVCMVRFGYLTSEKAAEYLLEMTKEAGISGYQVSNLMKGENFQTHLKEAISDFGGCRSIVADVQGRKGRSKRSIAGSEMDSTIYYGVNPASTFSKLKDFTP